MNPLTSILAVTDFSAPSRHAANRAARLAHETGAQMTLMHAVSNRAVDELRRWLGVGHRAEQHLLAEAGQHLQQLADELAAARQVTVQTHLVTGPVLDVISQHADAMNARLQIEILAHQARLKPDQWNACIVEGEAWQGIVEQEQAHDCDLVVLGKHGQSAAEELLLGSVTKSVLSEGSCDMLVSMARKA